MRQRVFYALPLDALGVLPLREPAARLLRVLGVQLQVQLCVQRPPVLCGKHPLVLCFPLLRVLYVPLHEACAHVLLLREFCVLQLLGTGVQHLRVPFVLPRAPGFQLQV